MFPDENEVTADESSLHAPGRNQASCVTLAFQSEQPLAEPLRFLLADVDSVSFSRGKGPARAERVQGGSEVQLRVEVPDKYMSSSHASLQKVFGRWLLEDQGSRNGTFLDGKRVDRVDLHDGAIFEIGHSFFVFRAAVPLSEPATDDSLQATFAAQLQALERMAPSNVPVVLRGESGTGKEVLARKVHKLSRRGGAFQAINCAALPPALVESELFGYRKGAFSGATEDRPGLIRSADKGTLFLDEIGDLPAAAQGSLLRALQESEVLPVGGTRPVPVDFRLIVATHRDLERMAAANAFRADLLARISGFTVHLPALRERKEDLGALTGALLRRLAPDRADALRLTPQAARALFLYDWPLNIRELEKSLAVALAIAPDATIDLPYLPPSLRAPRPTEEPAPALDPDEAKRRDELVELLKQHHGNVTAVARILGKARVQVQRWMRRYNLRGTAFR